jgi:hypothetical protein
VICLLFHPDNNNFDVWRVVNIRHACWSDRTLERKGRAGRRKSWVGLSEKKKLVDVGKSSGKEHDGCKKPHVMQNTA